MELLTLVKKIMNWHFCDLPYALFIGKSYILLNVFISVFTFKIFFLNWLGTRWSMCGIVVHCILWCLQMTNAQIVTLLYFCSEFAVQNAVTENGLPHCLIGFLVQKKISHQVMKAGKLCQEKMRMNLNYRVIAVVLKKKTKNCLYRKGMFNSEIYYFYVYRLRIVSHHIQMLGMLLICIYKPLCRTSKSYWSFFFSLYFWYFTKIN